MSLYALALRGCLRLFLAQPFILPLVRELLLLSPSFAASAKCGPSALVWIEDSMTSPYFPLCVAFLL